MASDTQKLRLEFALVNNPDFKKVSDDDHWIYIPRELQEAIAGACQEMEAGTIAEMIGRDISVLERWLEEYKHVAGLKDRVLESKRIKDPMTPYDPTIKPDVCKLAQITSVWMTSKAIDLPRRTIKDWMVKGWGKIDLTDEDGKDLLLASKIPGPELFIEVEIDKDPIAKQLEYFLKRHTGKMGKKYSPAEKKMLLEIIERFGSKAVHLKFGVSYDTIARLKRHHQIDRERRTRTPLRYIPVVDLMKRFPGMGPMQIRNYIKRHHGLSMGVNSIRKVMEQHGWVPPFAKISRARGDIRFYEAIRRNYMWHMDFKHQYINQTKAYILFIQDDMSRFIVGHKVTDSENVDDLLAALEISIRIHGKPETIMSDGGAAFFSWRGSSRFGRFLEDYGIDQLISKTPNVNGKLENLNQQLEKEVLLTRDFSSLKHFDSELAQWVGFYNFSRPHQGLGDTQVPADRFFPGAGKWYGDVKDSIMKQSMVAETMMTLLSELKKGA